MQVNDVGRALRRSAAAIALAVSFGAVSAGGVGAQQRVTPSQSGSAAAQETAQLLPVPDPQPVYHAYWDIDGWGWLRVETLGRSPWTGSRLLRVQLYQNGRVYSGSGSEIGGTFTFVLAGYFFENQVWHWGTYHQVGFPQAARWFWLE